MKKIPAGLQSTLILFSALIIAAILGYLYQILVELLPAVFLIWIFTIGLAIALGYFAAKVVYLGRCKGTSTAATVGLMIGIAALAAGHYRAYNSFTHDFNLIITYDYKSSGQEERIDSVSSYVAQRFKTGWTIESKKHQSSSQLKGRKVLLLWLLEAMLILLGSISKALGATHVSFCDNCGEWINEKKLLWCRAVCLESTVNRLKSAESVEELIRAADQHETAMQKDPHQLIKNLLEYKISVCTRCKKRVYLSIDKIRLVQEQRDREGGDAIIRLLRSLINARQESGQRRHKVFEDISLNAVQFESLKSNAKLCGSISKDEARRRCPLSPFTSQLSPAATKRVRLLIVGIITLLILTLFIIKTFKIDFSGI